MWQFRKVISTVEAMVRTVIIIKDTASSTHAVVYRAVISASHLIIVDDGNSVFYFSSVGASSV